jgi:hypothetical protein
MMRPLYSLTMRQKRRLIDLRTQIKELSYEEFMAKTRGIDGSIAREMFALNTDKAQLLETQRWLRQLGREEEWYDILLMVRRKNSPLYRALL